MKNHRKSGFTLSEMAIAATIFSFVIGAPALLFLSVNRSYRNESFSSEMDRQARTILDAVSQQLKLSETGSFTPPVTANLIAPNSITSLDFAQVTGYVGGAAVFGNRERIEFQYTAADPDDGLDNDSDGLIDEGRVVRIENVGLPNQRTRVLGQWVRESLEGEIPNNFIDDNANGLVDEGGFALDVDGNRVNVWLTLERRMSDGTLVTHTARKTIALRN